MGGRAIDGGNACKKYGKCLENFGQPCHIEWAGHQEAVGRSGVSYIGAKVRLGDIIFGHFFDCFH